jgi:hypothetical protein
VKTHWSAQIGDVVRDATYVLKQSDQGVLATEYDLFGFDIKETYYILDSTNDYMLYFYCGVGPFGEYQGAVVYTVHKTATLPAEIEQRFADVLADTGLDSFYPDFEAFCHVSYDQCS